MTYNLKTLIEWGIEGSRFSGTCLVDEPGKQGPSPIPIQWYDLALELRYRQGISFISGQRQDRYREALKGTIYLVCRAEYPY